MALLAGAAFALAASAQDKTVAVQDRALEYRIGAGDGIRISVFQNPNLTLDTRVAEDGSITYPLIGKVRLGGLTVAAAEQSIAKALEGGNFIQNPQVNILPVAIRSSQVSVLGLVNRPGRFPLETFNTKLSEMIAIAGGISIGAADVAILTGERAGKSYRREIDIPALFLHNKLDEDVTVHGGDVIYVHRAPVYYVYGEVHRPGSYRVERAMTVRQALVQAGGPTQRGTERSLRLHRRGADGKLEARSPALGDMVQPDDVLHVGDSLF
ncbi:MAG TPA: polysaccharide export protein EpsE [Burkholderiales bacterium]|nr:polysaccharide export protein EpsE [Burkholderiales bacterium]